MVSVMKQSLAAFTPKLCNDGDVMTDIVEEAVEEVTEEQFEFSSFGGKYVFPITEDSVISGMELRDYFAAKVMPIACKTTTNIWAVARMSYEYADAMIAVREEGKK